jgi:hypothetical protein
MLRALNLSPENGDQKFSLRLAYSAAALKMLRQDFPVAF